MTVMSILWRVMRITIIIRTNSITGIRTHLFVTNTIIANRFLTAGQAGFVALFSAGPHDVFGSSASWESAETRIRLVVLFLLFRLLTTQQTQDLLRITSLENEKKYRFRGISSLDMLRKYKLFVHIDIERWICRNKLIYQDGK